MAAVLAKRVQKGTRQIVVPKSVGLEPSRATITSGVKRRKLDVILGSGLSPQDAAKLLASSATAVTRLVRHRALYGIQTQQGWVLPNFQFRGARPVRNLAPVLQSLSPGLHPVEVVNWFTKRHSDLVLGDSAVSPVEWLEAGGDTAKLAQLAEELGSGL